MSNPVFIVAEMSGNHDGSLAKALEIVDAVAASGADALKLQTYTADTMTLDISDGEFLIDDPNSLWHGQTLYHLYQKAHTPWQWHKQIFARCREKNLCCFSTPFDLTAIHFLETLDNPIYKIASFEIIDLPLIRAAAQTGKPLVISTGMATLEEITDAVETVFATGNQQLTLLKCTSAYPASPKDANLKTMMDLQKRFGCSIGLSDHTTGNTTAIAAVTMGATFIEKHITLDKNNSVDGAFSLEPDQFTEFVTAIRQAEVIPGKIHYGVVGEDKTSYLHRRSLYVVQDIATGELLTPENIRSLRPGLGLSPKHYEQVMGKRAKSFLKRGQPLKKSDV